MAAPDFDRFLLPPPDDNVRPNRLATKLDAVTARALDKLDELLSLPINTDDGNLTRAQVAAANTVLNTQAKVDEMRLRAHTSPDIMPKIIAMLKEEKLKLALENEGTTED